MSSRVKFCKARKNLRRTGVDNAAMIAAAAFPKFLAGQFAGWETTADASLALGN